MIIIAFSENTSKFLPRILCRRFRHCAPIICDNKDLIMYQFVRYNHIAVIHLHARDIEILRSHGWKFIYISPDTPIDKFYPTFTYSCVGLCKHALGIRSIFIQTPYALYRYLTQK